MPVKTGRIFSGELAIVNQILPHRNKWAWDLFLQGQANNWSPSEVSMAKDVEQWRARGVLSEDERLVIKRCLGFFAGAESLVSNNLLLSIFRVVSDAECRQYLLRQAFEECYAEGTELLTPDGWKAIESVASGEKVAQYHPDGTVDFVECSNPVRYGVDEALIGIEARDGKTKLLVTKGHRMVVRDESGQLKTITADAVSYGHNHHIVSGRKIGGKSTLRPFERFQIAFQADGSFQKGRYRNGNRNGGFLMVTFSLTKQRKINRLMNLIEENGFKFTIGNNGKKRIIRVWVPRDAGLSKRFDWVDLNEVDSHWCQEFLSELSHWDGYRMEGYDLIGYDTTVGYNADVAQAVAALSGWRCKRGLRVDRRKATYKPLHRLTFLPGRDYVSRNTIDKTSVKYKGDVYCVTVPSGMLVVRYDGTVSISGNSLHNQTVVYVCDTLGLDIDEVFSAYQTIPSIKEKDDFLIGLTTDMSRPGFDLSTPSGKREALRNIVVYYLVCEGLLFYAGFAMLLSFGRQGKMPGISEQIQYTLRDEALHVQFGVQLVNTVIGQEPDVWTDDFKKEVVGYFRRAAELEIAYANDVLPRGVLGLNAGLFTRYSEYIANRRLSQIGLPPLYKGPKNPFPWMAEVIDLPKLKNFFETRVTEYKVNSLVDDL